MRPDTAAAQRAGAVGATAGAPISMALQRGVAHFAARATLGGFTGTTGALSGQVTSPEGPWRASGWVDVALDSLRTGNGTRDGHMRAALDTPAHPAARFTLDSLRPADGRMTAEMPTAATRDVRLFGQFRVHGVTRAVVAEGTLRREGPELWHVSARFPVTLAAHGIAKGLSRALGTLRVEPVVQVSIEGTFAR
jgi:polyisoprenoid-binding protein YceI